MSAELELKQIERLFLYFNDTPSKEKIVIGGIEPGIHYTMQLGTSSKLLDIHKTNEITGEHITLFTIKHYSLIRLFARFKPIMFFLYKKYWLSQKINIGKLKKYDCVLMPLNVEESEVHYFLRINKKKRTIKPPLKFDIENISKLMLFPEEILNHTEAGFKVYSQSNGKLLGMAIKNPLEPRAKSLYFISKKNFNLYNRDQMFSIFNLLFKTNFQGKGDIMPLIKETLQKKYPKMNGKVIINGRILKRRTTSTTLK
jgi:hypothetical protein